MKYHSHARHHEVLSGRGDNARREDNAYTPWDMLNTLTASTTPTFDPLMRGPGTGFLFGALPWKIVRQQRRKLAPMIAPREVPARYLGYDGAAGFRDYLVDYASRGATVLERLHDRIVPLLPTALALRCGRVHDMTLDNQQVSVCRIDDSCVVLRMPAPRST